MNGRSDSLVIVKDHVGDENVSFAANPEISPLLNPPEACVHGSSNVDCVTLCVLDSILKAWN